MSKNNLKRFFEFCTLLFTIKPKYSSIFGKTVHKNVEMWITCVNFFKKWSNLPFCINI